LRMRFIDKRGNPAAKRRQAPAANGEVYTFQAVRETGMASRANPGKVTRPDDS
jgi:hypothetical protein